MKEDITMKFDPSLLEISTLDTHDIDDITHSFCFPWTSPEETQNKWNSYLSEQKAGQRIACLARWQGKLIGYGSLLKNSAYPHFKALNIPEIHDVWILEPYRGHGFGKRLICHLEGLAQIENYRTIGIGVGLYKDYGKAQQLYIHLGYIPDGLGMTYKYQPTTPGLAYPMDDDLVLWLQKKLPPLLMNSGVYVTKTIRQTP